MFLLIRYGNSNNVYYYYYYITVLRFLGPVIIDIMRYFVLLGVLGYAEQYCFKLYIGIRYIISTSVHLGFAVRCATHRTSLDRPLDQLTDTVVVGFLSCLAAACLGTLLWVRVFFSLRLWRCCLSLQSAALVAVLR